MVDGVEKSGIGVPAFPYRKNVDPMSPTMAPTSSPAYDMLSGTLVATIKAAHPFS